MRSSYVQKYALWSAFNVTQALLLSPLFFMQPAILARAGLYTAGMVRLAPMHMLCAINTH